jgi:alpha-tubulin suppressor-like RCC1 family protein
MQRYILFLWYLIIAFVIVIMVISPITTAVVKVVDRVVSRNESVSELTASPQDETIAVDSNVDDEPVLLVGRDQQTLASGANHLCVVTQSAYVRCWGDNSAGQIGNGSDGQTTALVDTPITVSGLIDVASIALGAQHACAVRQRIGTVWCWGDNQFSQIGNNTQGPQTQQSLPQQVRDIRDIVQISAGHNHTCARSATGEVWCWGDNQFGQLAPSNQNAYARPVQVALPLPVTFVAAGGDTTCAITTDAEVWCWGDNRQRQLTTNGAERIVEPIRIEEVSGTSFIALTNAQMCGLIAERVWCRVASTLVAPELPAVALIRSDGAQRMCAVDSATHVWCWSASQVPVDEGVYGAVDVALGAQHTCIALRAAKIICRGDNQRGQLAIPVKQQARDRYAVVYLGHTGGVMSGGQSHMCALWQQGLVRCWGRNLEGQLGAPEQRDSAVPLTPDINGVTRVVAGGQHTCIVRYDQHVYCWGANDYGQLGINTYQRMSQPQQLWSLTSVASVTAGLHHTCALADSGEVWCWGDNRHQQIAGTATTYAIPTPVDTLPAVVKIASGGNANCALQYDGTVVCWGEPLSRGQMAFAPVPALQDVVDVQIGWRFACALQHTGQLVCWGDNAPTRTDDARLQPHVVTGMPPLYAMAVGGNHVCGIDRLQQLWCVGDNRYAQTDPNRMDAMLSEPRVVLSAVSHVALGYATSCARLQSGQTTCWGDASYGQLGTGLYEYSAETRTVEGINDGFLLAAGGNFSCALLKFVSIRCWGGNEYGQLGDGTTNTASLPQSLRSNDEFIDLATGSAHACAIVVDGTVRCWGHNNYGQLGNEATEDSNTPVIAAVQSVVDISLGQSHSCALLQDGGGACWGRNDDGQLGSGNTASSGMPLRVADLTTAIEVHAGGNHTCALLQDTTVVCWGRNQQGQLGIGDTGPGLSTPVIVPGLSDVAHISLGLDHTCALTHAGALFCWGWNRYGQVGTWNAGENAFVPQPQQIANISDIVQVTTGDNHTCVLQRNSQVRCWGDNYSGQLGIGESTGIAAFTTEATLVSGLTNVIAVSAGGAHTCAMLQRGDVSCWGWNNVGQVGNGSGGVYQDVAVPRPIVGKLGVLSVGVSAQHICMADRDGTVWCWGDNTFGQLGIGSETGTSTRTLPSEVDAAANTVAVSVGIHHTCALLVTNDLNCWGRNTIGQLGNSFSGDLADSPVPYFVGNFTGVTAFAVGGNQSCAIKDETVYCWGDNQYGQIANEPTGVGEFRTTPTSIAGVLAARDLVIGEAHVCALLADATVSCWGRNNQNQLGYSGPEMSVSPAVVPDVENVVGFAAGDNHTCAVRADGQVWCWGSNQYGQLGVVGATITSPQQVPGISDAVAVATGSAHTCILTRRQIVQCWGDNAHFQLGQQTSEEAAITSITLTDTPQQIAAGGNRTCVITASSALWCWGQNANNLLGVTANPDRPVPVMVQRLWEMRVRMRPLQQPTAYPTLAPRHMTATPRPTRVTQPTTTLIKPTLPTPIFQRVLPNDD